MNKITCVIKVDAGDPLKYIQVLRGRSVNGSVLRVAAKGCGLRKNAFGSEDANAAVAYGE